MSIIHSTFNSRNSDVTILGGTEPVNHKSLPISVVLLNRGGKYYRSAYFSYLESLGLTSVISFETTGYSYELESLSVRYPSVKFALLNQPETTGGMINIGIGESTYNQVLVLWNDMKLVKNSLSDSVLQNSIEKKFVSISPLFMTTKMETMPCKMVPVIENKNLVINPEKYVRDLSPTIYPWDFAGIYNKKEFMSVGGFDIEFSDPYWQNLDFGFRCAMWGYQNVISTVFKVTYQNQTEGEVIVKNTDYSRFYLKNLAPVYRKNKIDIPFMGVFPFIFKSGKRTSESWSEYIKIKKWVRDNGSKFKQDAKSVIQDWESE